MKSKEKILYVDYYAFCEWFFDRDRDNNNAIVSDLIEKGTISVQHYADNVGYLPIDLILNIEKVEPNDIKDDKIYVQPKYRIKI